jgi:hypothetical protein
VPLFVAGVVFGMSVPDKLHGHAQAPPPHREPRPAPTRRGRQRERRCPRG